MLKKVLLGIFIFVLILFVALITIPYLFKDKINSKIKEAINNEVTAHVDYGNFDLSLLRSFPNFSFSLNDFSIVGKDAFAGDTLTYIKQFNFTIDLMSVFKGDHYKILALNVINPMVNAKVDYSGKANWDIMKPAKDKNTASSSAPFTLEIKKYAIEHGEISYDDKKGNMSARLHDFNFTGSGNVTQDVYDFITKTNIAGVTYQSGPVAYLSNAKLAAEINISVDNINHRYTFKDNQIALNDLAIQFDGSVTTLKEATDLDVKFKSKQTEFKSILSLIPAIYSKDFDKIKTSGSLDLQGSVKGIYSKNTYPAFSVLLNVNNGMFQYPGLPVAVKNIFIASTINKAQGPLDLMAIRVPKLHAEVGADPIDAKINVLTPVSDPDVTATILGRLNLANVPKFYPMDGLKQLSGMMVMNLDFAGKQSDINNKRYEAIKAAGNLRVNDLVYESNETPMPVRVSDLQMSFNPRNVTLNSFNAVLGKSDFNATGSLDNFMAYLFNKGDLQGTLNLSSQLFDANEWLQKDKNSTAAATKDTASTKYFKVPAHIDFTANSNFGKILYDKIALTNVKGQVIIRDEAIDLDNLFANLLGGSANITAKYSTKGQDHPDVTFSYDIKNFDIGQTYQAVGMAQKMAPVMKFIQGSFSSNLKGSGKLNPDMSVDYNSLNGDGKVEIPSARVVNLPIFSAITKVAKIPALQNLELKNAWTVLKFNDGKVNVDPTDIKFGNGYNIHFQGANGFDESINYDARLDVPSKELGPATSYAQGLLSKIPGLNATMPDVLGFKFKITGTATKPIVTPAGITAGGGSSAKDILTNTADNLKQKAQDEVKKQTDALKQQADQELQKQKQAAQQKAQEAADKAKKDAEQQLKNVLKWPK